MSGKKGVKSAFETLIFVWGDPLSVEVMADTVGIDEETAYKYLLELQREYEEEGRGIRLREIDGAFQFVTLSYNEMYVRRMCTPVKKKRLSRSALEVLAIIAYKQPVTKSEVESVRGTRCDRVIEGLAKKRLICELGRSEAVGRPIMYGTTTDFLRYMGLKSLDELPDLEDVEGISEADSYDILKGDDDDAAMLNQLSFAMNGEPSQKL